MSWTVLHVFVAIKTHRYGIDSTLFGNICVIVALLTASIKIAREVF